MFGIVQKVLSLSAALLWACLPYANAGERVDPRLVPQYDEAGCSWPTFDSAGAAVVDYPEQGLQYNPITIAQVALGCYHQFKRHGKFEYEKIYLDQIKWLRTSYVSTSDDFAYYEYHFPWGKEGTHVFLIPPWRSGLAQGQAISALTRYHYDTGDASVLPLIRKLKNLMMLPVEKGGTLATTTEAGIW